MGLIKFIILLLLCLIKMVFVKYHKEALRPKNGLEDMLRRRGWSNLGWCPGNSLSDPGIREMLIGCPPSYDGELEDYNEEVIRIPAVNGKPWENSIEILVRNYLGGPVFSGPKGEAWC